MINTFLLAMILHPDAQHSGHEELDRVVGKDNLPKMEDRGRLPYIESICYECMRYVPVQFSCPKSVL